MWKDRGTGRLYKGGSSVTTIPLMKLDLKREHQVYRCKDGEKVPGVTTVLGVFAKEALIPWAAGEERDGVLRFIDTNSTAVGACSVCNHAWTAVELRAALPEKFFYATKRDKAADLGTIAHAHIEAGLKWAKLDPEGLDPEMYEQAMIPSLRFFDWVNDKKVIITKSEFQMVSEVYRAGGTGDVFGDGVDGLFEYWDVKTSKPWYKGVPYDEQIAQACAYADFYKEVTGVPVGKVRIARVGKTVGDNGNLFTLTDRQRVEGMALFSCAVMAYNAKNRLGWALKDNK